MTDAVNRKEDGVGTAHNPSEQPLAFLHTTIMVEKFRLRLFNKGPNVMDVPVTPPDIEESSALEIGRKGALALRISALWRRELCFGSSQFVTQLLGLRIGVAQRRLGLGQAGT